MNNCYIRTKSEPVFYFTGWDMYGQITMHENKGMAYFMRKTLAQRTLEKVNTYTKRECEVVDITKEKAV